MFVMIMFISRITTLVLHYYAVLLPLLTEKACLQQSSRVK